MTGIVLAGGLGTRLYPLTKSINKHCLPIYDRPMIYYPIQSLVKAGITNIILVTGGNHMSQFIDLLGDGSELGCKISYVAQMKPGGIAEAISLVEPFCGNENICVILGDNIFEEDISVFVNEFLNSPNGRYQGDFISKCHIACKLVPGHEAINYGVLSHGGGMHAIDEYQKELGQVYITEKPKFPLMSPNDMFKAVTGLYMYTHDVFDKIKYLRPSDRGELEVSELNDMYASTNDLTYSVTEKLWLDAGVSIDHLLDCSRQIKEINS